MLPITHMALAGGGGAARVKDQQFEIVGVTVGVEDQQLGTNALTGNQSFLQSQCRAMATTTDCEQHKGMIQNVAVWNVVK